MVSDYPLVLAEWVDSHGDGKWHQLDDLEDRALVCQSVGWLVLDGKHVKVLAPHRITEEEDGVVGQGCGMLTIPAVAVLRMMRIQGESPDPWNEPGVSLTNAPSQEEDDDA